MSRFGLIFPGQGSQAVGMGRDFYDNSQIAKEMIEAASDRLNIDMKSLMFEENDKLEQTQYTQPAILLVSSIASRLLSDSIDLKPELYLGHSLGEFSALVSTGAIDYLDGVELVHKRGLFMSEACIGGGAGMMALLGLADEVVENICKEAQDSGKSVWAANYNSDGQIVLAGIKDDLASLESTFKEAGAKRAILLNMSVASHCPLLSSAVDKLSPYLDNFIKDSFTAPVISNVTANPYSTKDEAIALLKEQLIKPVKYKQSMKANELNVDMFIEMGHGVVLKGLNRKVTKTPTLSLNSMKNIDELVGKLS